MLDKGRAAGRLLLDESERSEARRVRLPTELVVRRSTGRPRA
jgi:DNA-binding LacI/PurR family transcriptional regulator